MAINENKLADAVCMAEGGKESLSVAQVKEVIRLTLDELAQARPSEVLALLEKHAPK